jgi:TMEM175 potassium channel family protein
VRPAEIRIVNPDKIVMETDPNSRLEAFCDGVFAIALTLLILDIKISPSARIDTTHDFWLALKHMVPSLFSFLLSFTIILITWVNHHATLKLVNKSTPPFIYANGLLLLSVVLIPFPTGLLGEYLFTDHSAPAVILYSGVCGFQAMGWNLLTRTALKPNLLTKGENSTRTMRRNHRYSYFAFSIYTICAIAAIWFPRTVAMAIGLIWVIWLIISIKTRDE